MKLKLIITWISIFLICIIPVMLLFILGPKDYSSVSHTLGQVAGLVGMTMFALTFILSTRARWVEDIFDGLDKVYPAHAVLGATSMVLLLFHPLFLVMKFIPENFKLAAVYLLPGGLLSVDFGIYAMLGMIILLIVTLYGRIRYQRWKFSHEFLGLFFILAVLHVFLVRNTVARDYIFSGYYIYAMTVSVIGISAFLYSLMRNKLFGRKYRIKKINFINGCYEIIFEPVRKGIRFRSGQFVFVKFKNRKVGGESHPFSIASPSGDGTLRLIAKNLGDFTATLDQLKAGDYATLEGPYGRFHQMGYKDEIWVAGGIGITPFLGLAHDFRQNKSVEIDLFYSVKSMEEFVCLDELKDVAKANKNFRVIPWVTNEKGYLTVKEIAKIRPLNGKEYYLCGPDSLKNAMKKSLVGDFDIGKGRIHDERFAFK